MTGVAPTEEGSPIVTAVVIAYNRKRFLTNALESIAHQTLPKSAFEVLVLKNFDDADIDEYIARSEFKAIRMQEGPVGEYLARAVSQARGRIISFLDDDDEWEPDKLERVVGLFSEVPGLGFYSNDFSLIDEEGLPYRGAERLRVFPWQRSSRVLSKAGDRPGTLWKIHRTRPNFNNSSISVLKPVLAPYLSRLETIAGSEDSIAYYCAIASGLPLLTDRQKLTRFRLHPGNKSVPMRLGHRQRLEKSLKDAEKRLAALVCLEPEVRPKMGRTGRQVLASELTTEQLLIAISSNTSDRRGVAIKLPRYIACVILGANPQYARLSVLATIFVLSPGAARALYAGGAYQRPNEGTSDLVSDFVTPKEIKRDEWEDLVDRTAVPSGLAQRFDASIIDSDEGMESRFVTVRTREGRLVGGARIVVEKRLAWRHVEMVGGPLFLPGYESGVKALVSKSLRESIRSVDSGLFRPIEGHDWHLEEFGLHRSAFGVETAVVDLTVPIDRLWSDVEKSERWAVRKARDKGLSVREVTTEEEVERLYPVLERFSRERKFLSYSKARLLSTFRLFHPTGKFHLLVCEGDHRVAGLSAVLVNNRRAKLLLLASVSEFSKAQPASLLVWETMTFSKSRGATSFDLFGLPPRGIGLDGIRSFKLKWGGELVGGEEYIEGPLLRITSRAIQGRPWIYRTLIAARGTLVDSTGTGPPRTLGLFR